MAFPAQLAPLIPKNPGEFSRGEEPTSISVQSHVQIHSAEDCSGSITEEPINHRLDGGHLLAIPTVIVLSSVAPKIPTAVWVTR